MGHALHAAEKSSSRSPGRTSSHAPMVMRQAALTSQDILQPKADPCACGGSCPRCQAKSTLKIGAADDAYEREADTVADRVMRMAGGEGPITPASSSLQRKCTACEMEDEEPLVQTKAESSSPSTQGDGATAPSSVVTTLRSPGQALDSNTRAFFEPRFGHDFSRVRVHSDAAAARSARDVSALAYTVGHDIVFGAGRLAPGTNEGRRLIAHELTHVVQQSRAEGIRLDQSYEKRGLSPISLDETAAHAAGGSAYDLSQVPVRATAPVTLQAKLTISSPGDVYEREADHVADRVMRMPEPARHGACACGGTCPSCQAGAPNHQARLNAKHVDSGYSGQVDAPAGVHDVLAGSGQPLDASSRTFFEPRFGQDFSQVRVHTDAAAEQSAREVSANAYTVGHHIVFAPGRFAPHSVPGRHLLAHELTHVVQQSRTPSAPHPLLQRDIGVEFQLRDNTIKTNTGRTFGRKAGKFFHRVPAGDKHGLELQTDNGSVMEFETHHFQKFSDLQAQVQSAVDVVNEIKKDPKAFPFNQEARFRKDGLLKKGETLEVDVIDSSFQADIQSTEGIALSQYESLLKEHERDRPVLVDPVLLDAQNILTAAMAASKSVKAAANVDNLLGFLQLILNYVRRGQNELWDKTAQGVVKATFRLMMRTNFALAFKKILTKDEQSLFRDIVKTDAIPKAVGIAATDPFFKTGYWGDLNGQHAFFEHGKVTALEAKGTIHDCSTAAKTPGVDSKQCNAKIAGTDITVGGWLKSIVQGKQDLLSPAAHGSSSMGQLPVSKKPAEKNLVVLEVRGTVARNRTQPASKWLDYVDEVFSQAAACRARADATNLNYDGKKPFDPTNCP